MKQTVKEAAKGFAESVIDSFGRSGVPSGVSDIKEMIALGFENGCASIACGIRPKMKCHKLMVNTKMNIIHRYRALSMEK